jgi:hypothetical protein
VKIQPQWVVTPGKERRGRISRLIAPPSPHVSKHIINHSNLNILEAVSGNVDLTVYAGPVYERI